VKPVAKSSGPGISVRRTGTPKRGIRIAGSAIVCLTAMSRRHPPKPRNTRAHSFESHLITIQPTRQREETGERTREHDQTYSSPKRCSSTLGRSGVSAVQDGSRDPRRDRERIRSRVVIAKMNVDDNPRTADEVQPCGHPDADPLQERPAEGQEDRRRLEGGRGGVPGRQAVRGYLGSPGRSRPARRGRGGGPPRQPGPEDELPPDDVMETARPRRHHPASSRPAAAR